MVTISSTASQKLQDIMTEKNIGDHALRVFVSGSGCSGLNYGMTFAPGAEADDTVFDTAGLKVIIDPASFPYLEGAQIDFTDSPSGSGFRIDNPNMASGCGCGSESGSGSCGSGGCSCG